MNLEQSWVRFQLEIAALRPVMGQLCNAAFEARRHHTFLPKDAPRGQAVRARMGSTAGEPNGVPDAFTICSNGSYVARTTSVAAASVILLWFDAAIQKYATDLGQVNGAAMLAGDDFLTAGMPSVKASTLIWAGANSVRHVDEWYATRSSYANPRTSQERSKRDQQKRSMEPLSMILGVSSPITENCAFEVLHHLVATTATAGDYPQLERHVLRIGQDLVERSGLPDPKIGVTIDGFYDAAAIAATHGIDMIVSDGTVRAAGSLPDSIILGQIGPADAET